MSQARALAKPFKPSLIHGNPSGGGSYVKHGTITQRLLLDVGPYDFELVEIVRGDIAGKPGNPKGTSERARAGTPDLHNVVVGAVARLRCDIDGRVTTVEEAGDCESPHNWPHDGARLKDAMSDALKRCAMRLGLGLHLWCQEEYALYDALAPKEGPSS